MQCDRIIFKDIIMNIECKKKIITKTQEEFHAIDKIVTGFAFDIHNDIGNFCDEKIYQKILLQKCPGHSIKANSEVGLTLTYKDFIKLYKIDLLVDNSIIYELKTARSLNAAHKQQLLNYLLLSRIKHGKLLNLRTASVEYEFVSTSLTTKDRYNYSTDFSAWLEITDKCIKLKSIFLELLQEWGAFLDYHIYNEAVTHFLSNGRNIIQAVNIYFNGQIVGRQKMHLLNSTTAFHLSAITRKFTSYKNNIKRLIKHTDIKEVQWINLNHHNIKFKTIE